MNRATAEAQKEIAEEEGFVPVLAWVKDMIDSVIAQELDAPDLEYSFSAEDTTQENLHASNHYKQIGHRENLE